MYDTIVAGHADNGLWKLSPNKILELIDSATKAEKTALDPIIGVIDSDDKEFAAMTCFRLETYWYTDEWHICELFNWVNPKYRVSDYARQIMNFQKKWTDDLTEKANYKIALLTGVMSIKRLEAKMNLFGRRYKQIGALYSYNLDVPEDSFNQRKIGA